VESTGLAAKLVQFVSSRDRDTGVSTYTDLIGYEYNSSLRSQADPFSLTFVPRSDINGQTWKDKIQARDIVYISEFGKIRYIGIVRNTGYTMSMNNGKPQRSVVVSGESIGGMLESFNLPMNIYLWFNISLDAEKLNNELTQALNSKLDEKQDIGQIFSLINDKFFSVTFGSSQSRSGFAAIIDRYFELVADDLQAFYAMNIRPFQTESNTLWSIYRQILPEPVYEIFGLYENEKYKLVCRETPFDYSDWKNLPITTLNPLYLISQDLSDTDAEVFTHYYSTLPNSAYSQNEIYADSALNEVSVFDEDKLPVYGYRQLQATFPFFDIDQGKDFSAKEFLKENSRRLYSWYVNNVEFQSGTITMMTVPEKDENNEYINIGERIKYLEGSGSSIEFYVEAVKRKMTYPDTMTSSYSVTRGYEYGRSSVTIDGRSITTPQVRKINQLGRKLVQTERDIFERADK
jgi:hypothetical protein